MSYRIPWARPSLGFRERRYVEAALDSTWISGGPFVEQLERLFAGLHDSYGIAVSNGTTALELALRALDVGAGDEVIVPGWCFVAAGNMVIACGARPVFAEIEADTWSMDPRAVEAELSATTKAIIVVHNYGNVADLGRLRELADARGVALIEDVAEAPFSRRGGRLAGTVGDIGCFSFQATKTITTGEGGFVITQRLDLHERMRVLRDHGMRPGRRYWHDEVGHNFRLTNLQAAIGCAQLEAWPHIFKERDRVWHEYQARLVAAPGLRLQHFSRGVEPIVWSVAAYLDEAHFGQRDDVIEALARLGIETRPAFHPFLEMPLYSAYGRHPLPIAADIGAHVISLPTYPSLTNEEIATVCTELRRLGH